MQTPVSDVSALPLGVVFGIITVLLIKAREVPWWAAVLIFLFGIYTALTPAVSMVTSFVNWVVERFTA